jgi:hypothetical protein
MVPFVRDGHRGGPDIGGPAADRPPGVLPLPPADAPGAAANPAAVGTDPSVLHFDVDLTGTLATGAYWSVRDGVESVRLWTADFDHFNHEYRLSTDLTRLDAMFLGNGSEPAKTQPLKVGGRHATARFWPEQVSSNKKPDVPTWTVDWQPVDGLWARASVHTVDVDGAIRAAEALILSRSQRCVAPLRLDPSTAGYRLIACSVEFGHLTPWSVSNVVVERPDGVRFDVGIGHFSYTYDDGRSNTDPPSYHERPYVPNRMVGDRPGMLYEEYRMKTVFVPIVEEVNLVVRAYRAPTAGGNPMGAPPAGLTDDELVAFAAGITVGPNLTDPDTWPRP